MYTKFTAEIEDLLLLFPILRLTLPHISTIYSPFCVPLSLITFESGVRQSKQSPTLEPDHFSVKISFHIGICISKQMSIQYLIGSYLPFLAANDSFFKKKFVK